MILILKSLIKYQSQHTDQTCPECGEEFCYGACVKYQYDCYQRMDQLVDNEADTDNNKQKKGKKAVKKKKKSTKQHAMLERNNIQNYTNLRQ